MVISPMALLPQLADRPISTIEAAFILRISVEHLQRIVRQHRLPRLYRRIGKHPRKYCFLPPESLAALKEIIYSVNFRT